MLETPISTTVRIAHPGGFPHQGQILNPQPLNPSITGSVPQLGQEAEPKDPP